MCEEGKDQETLSIITSQLFSTQMRWWGNVFCNSWVRAAYVRYGAIFAGFLTFWGTYRMDGNLLQFDHLTWNKLSE